MLDFDSIMQYAEIIQPALRWKSFCNFSSI